MKKQIYNTFVALLDVNKKKYSNRNVNFEILSVISMSMIVVIHFYTGSMKAFTPSMIGFSNEGAGFYNFCISQTIIPFVSIGVNLFVLKSGFFMIESPKSKYIKVANIWLQTSFYSIAITLLYFLFSGDFDFVIFLKSFTPIRSNLYWFVTQYVALILLAPFITRMVMYVDKREYTILLFILCFLQLDIYHFPYADRYGNSYGHSLLFFILLFLTGGYIRRYRVFSNFTMGKKWLITIMLAIIIVIESFLLRDHYDSFFLKVQANHSLLFFLSILFFICIRDTKFGTNKIVNFIAALAPYTFGVYLIHANSYSALFLWDYLLPGKYICNNIYYIPIMICFTLLLFLTCIFIDYVRSAIVMIIKKRLYQILSKRQKTNRKVVNNFSLDLK